MKAAGEPVCPRQHCNDGVVLHRGSDRIHDNVAEPPLESDRYRNRSRFVAVRSGQCGRTGGPKRPYTRRESTRVSRKSRRLAHRSGKPSRTQVFVAVRRLAGQFRLTGYDAAYLELANRHKLPIASLDKALSKAALAAGINTVQA